jgi:hypothetical protein
VILTRSASLIDSTAIIDVVVGTSPERRWVVHEQLLTSASRFAKAALALPFKEREERTLRLPEEDPDVFDQFVKYLYTSAIGDLPIDMRLQLYVLGDRMQATTLCDRVRATLDGLVSTFFDEAQLEYVLENTSPGDGLRRICILRLGVAARTWPYFPFSDRFIKLVCQKYAGEILADMINKYETIIMRSAGDDSSVISFPTPEPLAGSKLQGRPQDHGSSPWTAQFPTSSPLFGSSPASVSRVVSQQTPTPATPSIFAKEAVARTTPALENGGAGLFGVSASSTSMSLSQSIFGHATIIASKVTGSNVALSSAKSTEPSLDIGSTESARGASLGQQAAGGTSTTYTGLAMANATNTPTTSPEGGSTNATVTTAPTGM